MALIILLTLRQLAGARRLAIVGAVALLPAALAIYSRQAAGGAASYDDFANATVDGLIVALVMPIVTMALATASLGNEMEDRTLSFIALQPIARWKTALAKLIAPSLIAVPLTAAGAAAAAYAELGGAAGAERTALAVGGAVAVGAFAYCSVFTWLGLITSRALAFALVYVFMWEAAVATFIGGARYLSVRGYTLGMMDWLDSSPYLSALSARAIEPPAALIGAALVCVLFYALTVRRLKGMDIP